MIQNFIFDLGGVLYDVDFAKTKDAFVKIGYPHFDEFFTQFHSNPLFEKFETGAISDKDFLNEVQQYSEKAVTQDQITEAWNAMLGGFRMKEVAFVKSLKKERSVFLLSNTNSIHYGVFQPEFFEQTGHNFDDCFNGAHYSHILRKRKPYPETFTHLITLHDLIPEETLFIDDSYTNTEGAAKAGLHTLLLKPGELVSKIIPSFL
jgi:putative hydrolase of the HAD superfamily